MQRRSFLVRIGAAVGALAAARCVTPEPVWGETASTPAAVPVTIDPPYGITGYPAPEWATVRGGFIVSKGMPRDSIIFCDPAALRRMQLRDDDYLYFAEPKAAVAIRTRSRR